MIVPEPDIGLAERIFDTLRRETSDIEGVTRAAYGAGEQVAHDLIVKEAVAHGLTTAVDAAGNLSVTLAGSGEYDDVIIVGSHMDTVPMGGNYDGAAGVIAGLAVAAGWQRAGFRLSRDLTVLAIRAEESNWFPFSYVGSKAALGLLPAEALTLCRSDTGRTLADHMSELGLRPDEIAAGTAQIDSQRVRAYVELHIEQGPFLVQKGLSSAVVTSIPGSVRRREVRVLGEYAHSGAVPRAYRHDSVIGAADVVMRLQHEWLRMEAQGHDMVYTVGILTTDPEQHAFSKISGEVKLSIDVRSSNPQTLATMAERISAIASEVGSAHGVTVDLGPLTDSKPAIMDRRLVALFGDAMDELGLPRTEMVSGAGHDAAVFADVGIPTLMLFVRNEHSSHNPHEAMEIGDFADATRILANGLARIP